MFDQALLAALALTCHDSGQYTEACKKSTQAFYAQTGYQQEVQTTDRQLQGWATKQKALNNKVTNVLFYGAKAAAEKKVQLKTKSGFLGTETINFTAAKQSGSVGFVWGWK